MDIDYFYSLTPRQFNNILKGYYKKLEFNYQNGWEQTRRIMHCLLLPHQRTNKQGKVIKPLALTDVIKFDWDVGEKQPKKEIGKQEAADFWRRVDERQSECRIRETKAD